MLKRCNSPYQNDSALLHNNIRVNFEYNKWSKRKWVKLVVLRHQTSSDDTDSVCRKLSSLSFSFLLPLNLVFIQFSPSFSHPPCLRETVRGKNRKAEGEEREGKEEERGREAEKPFYNWVTWKCQRWGARVSTRHTHTHLFSPTHTNRNLDALTHFLSDTFMNTHTLFRVRQPCRWFSFSLVKGLLPLK